MTMLKSARALGIVCFFRHRGEPWEGKLQEGSWAHQFYTSRFNALQEKGVVLQNL